MTTVSESPVFKEAEMIRSFRDMDKLASGKGPKRLVVLAPEDEEFMMAVKRSAEEGYTRPVLIGDREKMERLAGQVQYDISGTEKIYEKSRQAIADLGISMLFSGEVDIAGKGQIPTAYIYRAIIREESKIGKGKVVSVISMWDIEGLEHLTCFTDTGVNIAPDYRAKAEIARNAVFLFHLLGYPRPKICALSGKREINGDIPSYQDYLELKKAAASGELGSCEMMAATSFLDIFSPGGKAFRLDGVDIGRTAFPHIMLVPNLATGNILCKLDFALKNARRRSLVMSSRGPIIIPSRSDFQDSILGEIAAGVTVAEQIKGGKAS
jgi:phosphate butyryltransferase